MLDLNSGTGSSNPSPSSKESAFAFARRELNLGDFAGRVLTKATARSSHSRKVCSSRGGGSMKVPATGPCSGRLMSALQVSADRRGDGDWRCRAAADGKQNHWQRPAHKGLGAAGRKTYGDVWPPDGGLHPMDQVRPMTFQQSLALRVVRLADLLLIRPHQVAAERRPRQKQEGAGSRAPSRRTRPRAAAFPSAGARATGIPCARSASGTRRRTPAAAGPAAREQLCRVGGNEDKFDDEQRSVDGRNGEQVVAPLQGDQGCQDPDARSRPARMQGSNRVPS
jgi:hypothetical protein